MNKLKQFLAAATTDEKAELATAAGTTVGNLRQAAGQYQDNSRMKAGLARRIEIAADGLRKKNPSLPVLRRTDLCADCAACEFAQKVLGDVT